MKKEIFKEIEIPEGVTANIDGKILTIKGKEGENKKEFKTSKLLFEVKGNKIIVGNKKSSKNEKKMINTIAAHVHNMIQGVQKKFEYQLKVVFSHFPITAEVKGNEVHIKNFLGEKNPRICPIPKGAEVKVEDEVEDEGNTQEV